MNKKLIAPIVTAGAVFACAVGTTFALFTSKASSEIDINAGKVKVDVASTLDFAVSHYEKGADAYDAVAHTVAPHAAVFENGGTVDITTEAPITISLDRISPLDQVSVNMSATNSSDINIKWRYYVEIAGDLMPGLEIEIDDVDYSVPAGYDSPKTIYGHWSDVVTPDITELMDINVVVTFPDREDNNLYQEKEGSIKFGVEAVQGNAEVSDDYVISTAADLMNYVKAWNNGTPVSDKNVSLGADIDLSEETWVPLGTWDNPYFGEINGNGHKITGLSNQGKTVEEIELETFTTTTTHSFGAAYGLIGVAGSSEADKDVVVKNLVLSDVDINLTDGNCTGPVIGYAPQNSDFTEKAGGIGAGNFAIKNVTLTDITVDGEVHAKDSVSGLMGKAYNPGKLTVKNVETDVLVEALNGRAAGLLGYASLPSSSEITANVVNNDVKATKTGVDGIVIGFSVGSNHLVYNNEFNGNLYWQGALVTSTSGRVITYNFDETGVCTGVDVVLTAKQTWETGLMGINTNVTVKNSVIDWDFSVSGTNNKFVNVTTSKKLSIDGELTVDGGTFSGANNVGYNDGRVGNLTVKNGNFTGLLSLFSGEITIEDGTFIGGPRVRAAQGSAIINVSGGRFTVKPCADATEVVRTTINYIGGTLSNAKDADGYYYFIPENI